MVVWNGHILVPGVSLRWGADGPFFFPPHPGPPSLLAIASLQLRLLGSACVVSNCFLNPKNRDSKIQALPHCGGPGPPRPLELCGLVGMWCLSEGPGQDSQARACPLVPKSGFVESGWAPVLSKQDSCWPLCYEIRMGYTWANFCRAALPFFMSL